MNGGLHVTAEELRIVRDILAACLPPDSRVFAFGSRATGIRLKPWSDLDLAVQGAGPMSLDQTGLLREAFDESLLPWKVDILDLATVSETFRRIIEPDLKELE